MATHFVFKNLFKSGYSKLNTLPTSSTTTVATMLPCLTRPTRQRRATQFPKDLEAAYELG